MYRRFALLGIIFTLFLFIGPGQIFAQHQLFLEKPPFKRVEIQPGDSIRIQLKGGDYMIGLTYQGSQDSMLYVSNDSIPLNVVDRIWLRRSKASIHWLGSLVGSGLTAAIVFPPLMVIDALSRGGLRPYDARRIGVSVGGGLLIAGYFYRLRWKRFRLGDKWRLAIRQPVEDTVVPQ